MTPPLSEYGFHHATNYARKISKVNDDLFISTKEGMLYLTTDDLIDQNDENRRRWGSKRLKEVLSKCRKLPVYRQKLILENALDSFSNGEKQRDDIAIMGIRI